jgi:hypothetical protein
VLDGAKHGEFTLPTLLLCHAWICTFRLGMMLLWAFHLLQAYFIFLYSVFCKPLDDKVAGTCTSWEGPGDPTLWIVGYRRAAVKILLDGVGHDCRLETARCIEKLGSLLESRWLIVLLGPVWWEFGLVGLIFGLASLAVSFSLHIPPACLHVLKRVR